MFFFVCFVLFSCHPLTLCLSFAQLWGSCAMETWPRFLDTVSLCPSTKCRRSCPRIETNKLATISKNSKVQPPLSECVFFHYRRQGHLKKTKKYALSLFHRHSLNIPMNPDGSFCFCFSLTYSKGHVGGRYQLCILENSLTDTSCWGCMCMDTDFIFFLDKRMRFSL